MRIAQQNLDKPLALGVIKIFFMSFIMGLYIRYDTYQLIKKNWVGFLSGDIFSNIYYQAPVAHDYYFGITAAGKFYILLKSERFFELF